MRSRQSKLIQASVRLWIRKWHGCWAVDARLGPETRGLIASSDCVVSVASTWEVAIKHRLGKLAVTQAPFRDQSLAAGAVLLPVLEGHVIETAQLPLVHQDPFDRRMGTGLVTTCRCLRPSQPPRPR